MLCVLSGSFFMHCGGLLSLAPTPFHRHWGSSEGEHSTPVARPHQNANYQTRAHSGTAPRCGGNLFAPVESNLSKKTASPKNARRPPPSSLALRGVSGHARVNPCMMPRHAPLVMPPRARRLGEVAPRSVTAAVAFAASSSARAARSGVATRDRGGRGERRVAAGAAERRRERVIFALPERGLAGFDVGGARVDGGSKLRERVRVRRRRLVERRRLRRRRPRARPHRAAQDAAQGRSGRVLLRHERRVGRGVEPPRAYFGTCFGASSQ